jgi:serine/threonine-protein kinase
MISPTDIFVSYKSEDRDRLQPLISALEAEGFSVWWDRHIGGGTRWREEIQEHLDAAKCVIVAWTKRSVGPAGDFVRDEATRAQRRGSYLPIRFDRSAPPLGFGEIQVISLKGWRGDRSDPRFRAIAEAVRRRVTGEDIDQVTVLPIRTRLSRRALLAGGTSAVALTGVGGWLLLKPAPANANRIAVLPFADLSPGRDQAYFSDGVAEELRSTLSRIGLQVIGRNSCDAVKHLDIRSVAAKLNAANVLTGSVRRSPEMLRVNAQLVSGADGVERWGRSYDRATGDAIKIQTDIALNVAQALSIALGQTGEAALTLGGTKDSVAQDLVLQARKLRREGSGAQPYRNGLTLVEAAIARDPNYADAYVLKAVFLESLASQFGPNINEIGSQRVLAKESANRALAIAPNLAAAHAALATINKGRLNFRGSLEHLRRALFISPDDPEALAFATNTLQWFGLGQEAVHLADRYIALDPLNAQAFRRKAQVLHALRQYPQSVEAGQKSIELAPKASRLWVGNSLLLLDRPGDALEAFLVVSADDPFRVTGEALVAARSADRAKAERIIGQMKEEFGAVRYQIAQIRAQLGQTDLVFAELDNAMAVKDPGLIYLKMDPFMDPIRGDPRYATWISRLNFP